VDVTAVEELGPAMRKAVMADDIEVMRMLLEPYGGAFDLNLLRNKAGPFAPDGLWASRGPTIPVRPGSRLERTISSSWRIYNHPTCAHR
jgi:hypothetical protein